VVCYFGLKNNEGDERKLHRIKGFGEKKKKKKKNK
jgi:hypothetical protein